MSTHWDRKLVSGSAPRSQRCGPQSLHVFWVPQVSLSHFPTRTLGFVFCQTECLPAVRTPRRVSSCRNSLWAAGWGSKASLPVGLHSDPHGSNVE